MTKLSHQVNQPEWSTISAQMGFTEHEQNNTRHLAFVYKEYLSGFDETYNQYVIKSNQEKPVTAASHGIQDGEPSAVSTAGQTTNTPAALSTPDIMPGVSVTTGRAEIVGVGVVPVKQRKQVAVFLCPVPGCGKKFTRSFNLRGWFFSFFFSLDLGC